MTNQLSNKKEPLMMNNQNNQPSPEEVEKNRIFAEMGLTDEEYELIKDILKRKPNFTETGIFSVMWSEHCSYKTSSPLLSKFPTKGPQVIQGPGEGAGVVDIGDNQAVVFKMESHNSPSAVEPFEGAATGVGGITRDIFSMGARPIAALNSLRFGPLSNERDRYLFKEAVRGIAWYGNTLEVPTVGGEVKFEPCYESKPLVNAMVVGLLKHDEIQKGIADGVGNLVLYAGAPTGRDGIHGATFSSSDVDETEDHTSNVAIGNPEIEKRLIDACLEAIHSDALIGMQDMGAAGLTSSSSEMAAKSGTGIEMNMDLVPAREDGMNAYELMLSESQERMLLVVKLGEEQEIISIFEKYDIPVAVIGEVIEEKVLRLVEKGNVVCDVPVDPLADDVPVNHLPKQEPAYFKEFQAMEPEVPRVTDHAQALKDLLSVEAIASKEFAYSQFDSEARGKTISGPGAGAAVVQIEDTDKGVAVSADCNSRFIYLDPRTGGKIAVAEAARNLVAKGAKPLGLTDGLNYGDPTNPEVFWQMDQSIEGISEACEALDTPVVSGNVSLYNQSQGNPIYPTPIIGMVGLVESLSHVTPDVFQNEGDAIYLVGTTEAEFGGSELQKLINKDISGRVPELSLETEKTRQAEVLAAIQKDLVESATDLSEGGLAVGLALGTFAKKLGVQVELQGDVTTALFSESQSRFVVTVKEENEAAFVEMVSASQKIGTITNDGLFNISVNNEVVISEKVEELNKLWKDTIPNLLKF